MQASTLRCASLRPGALAAARTCGGDSVRVSASAGRGTQARIGAARTAARLASSRRKPSYAFLVRVSSVAPARGCQRAQRRCVHACAAAALARDARARQRHLGAPEVVLEGAVELRAQQESSSSDGRRSKSVAPRQRLRRARSAAAPAPRAARRAAQRGTAGGAWRRESPPRRREVARDARVTLGLSALVARRRSAAAARDGGMS